MHDSEDSSPRGAEVPSRPRKRPPSAAAMIFLPLPVPLLNLRCLLQMDSASRGPSAPSYIPRRRERITRIHGRAAQPLFFRFSPVNAGEDEGRSGENVHDYRRESRRNSE